MCDNCSENRHRDYFSDDALLESKAFEIKQYVLFLKQMVEQQTDDYVETKIKEDIDIMMFNRMFIRLKKMLKDITL